MKRRSTDLRAKPIFEHTEELLVIIVSNTAFGLIVTGLMLWLGI